LELGICQALRDAGHDIGNAIGNRRVGATGTGSPATGHGHRSPARVAGPAARPRVAATANRPRYRPPATHGTAARTGTGTAKRRPP